eukprot:3484567-Prymnesium_polylepis.1
MVVKDDPPQAYGTMVVKDDPPAGGAADGGAGGAGGAGGGRSSQRQPSGGTFDVRAIRSLASLFVQQAAGGDAPPAAQGVPLPARTPPPEAESGTMVVKEGASDAATGLAFAGALASAGGGGGGGGNGTMVFRGGEDGTMVVKEAPGPPLRRTGSNRALNDGTMLLRDSGGEGHASEAVVPAFMRHNDVTPQPAAPPAFMRSAFLAGTPCQAADMNAAAAALMGAPPPTRRPSVMSSHA